MKRKLTGIVAIGSVLAALFLSCSAEGGDALGEQGGLPLPSDGDTGEVIYGDVVVDGSKATLVVKLDKESIGISESRPAQARLTLADIRNKQSAERGIRNYFQILTIDASDAATAGKVKNVEDVSITAANLASAKIEIPVELGHKYHLLLLAGHTPTGAEITAGAAADAMPTLLSTSYLSATMTAAAEKAVAFPVRSLVVNAAISGIVALGKAAPEAIVPTAETVSANYLIGSAQGVNGNITGDGLYALKLAEAAIKNQTVPDTRLSLEEGYFTYPTKSNSSYSEDIKNGGDYAATNPLVTNRVIALEGDEEPVFFHLEYIPFSLKGPDPWSVVAAAKSVESPGWTPPVWAIRNGFNDKPFTISGEVTNFAGDFTKLTMEGGTKINGNGAIGITLGAKPAPTQPNIPSVVGRLTILETQIGVPVTGQYPHPKADEAGVYTFRTDCYRADITWDVLDGPASSLFDDGKFGKSTVYRATLALEALEGYNFDGLTENAFTYKDYLQQTLTAPPESTQKGGITNAAVTTGTTAKVIIVFPRTGEEVLPPATVVKVTLLDLSPPLVSLADTGATPTRTVDTDQYAGPVVWTPDSWLSDGAFGRKEVYTATVTLTAKHGYTFAGVNANEFTYTGGGGGVTYGHAPSLVGSITNPSGAADITMDVTIIFPETGQGNTFGY